MRSSHHRVAFISIRHACDVFQSSPYFHIGSDEVTSGRLSLHSGYKAFLKKHRLKNDSELVTEAGIVGAAARDRSCGEMARAILVLKAFS